MLSSVYSYIEEFEKTGEVRCTNFLINDRFLLTAAHCNINFDPDHEQELTRAIVLRDNTPYREVVEVRRVFSHPLFQAPNATYDIAVIELGSGLDELINYH